MTRSRVVAVTAAAFIAAAAVVLYSSRSWAAQEQAAPNHVTVAPQANEQLEIAIGLKIAPVTLKYPPANEALVGLGSYIVNGQGACNDCHTNPPFAPGGDPFLGQPTRDQRGALSGWRDAVRTLYLPQPYAARERPACRPHLPPIPLRHPLGLRREVRAPEHAPVTGHALADLPKHARLRSRGDLRLLERDPTGHPWAVSARIVARPVLPAKDGSHA